MYTHLKQIIDKSNNIVFFGGAGVSTESGIPDFRSTSGLFHSKYKWPPETILSHSFYKKNKREFFEFYKDKMIYADAKPNIAHKKLVELEKEGKLKAVITQNIDGLHQIAGNKKVLELHGSIHRNYCELCKKYYNLNYIIKSENIPVCECGGSIKPDVVLYEEGLDSNVLEEAIDYISNADVLIVAGTSLAVYPAAGLIRYYSGNNLVLINRTKTPYDEKANILIQENVGEVFKYII